MTPSFNTFCIGVDVSKSWLDIAIDQGVTRIDNTPEAIGLFIKASESPPETVWICESTGGYERPLVLALRTAGLRVHVAHPSRVRAFGRAKGYFAKTDKIDAKLLQEYGFFLKAEPVTFIKSAVSQELRDLYSRYVQVKAQRLTEISRLDKPVCEQVKRFIEQGVSRCEEEMKEIIKVMKSLLKEEKGLKERDVLLRSCKGVGEITALALIAHLPELGSLGHKQIAALVGVAPRTHESGKTQRKSRIAQGRASVRHVLYMAALTAAQHNPVMKVFYQRLIQKGKGPKVALTAVMRKIITTLNAMVQKNTPWRNMIFIDS